MIGREKNRGGNGFLIADLRFQIDLDVGFWAKNGGGGLEFRI